MKFDLLSNLVIGCALEVHRYLGPGLLESTYEQCLAREMQIRRVGFTLQWPLPVEYKGLRLDCGYRVDMLVENSLILELKAVDKVAAVHRAQLLSYMRLARIRTGLLINFNVAILKSGIQRFVL
jgi:GxxExxY protein